MFSQLKNNLVQANTLRSRVDLAGFYLALLIAFFLPINQKIIGPLILLLGLVSIFSWVKYGVKKLSFQYWPFILLFVIYAVGLLFSVNYDYGGKDIETRLSFVIFPLLFGLTKREKPINVKIVIYALVIGLFVAILKNYYFSYRCFVRYCYIECFEGSRLSYGMHPSYFASYLIAGGAFFLFALPNWKKKKKYLIGGLVLLIFFFMVYRLYSLGAWVGLLGMITFLLYAYFHFKKKQKYFFIGILGMGLMGIIAVSTLPFLKSDFQEVNHELSAYFDNPDEYIAANKDDPHSTNARILIWITSANFIAEHPYGVGTGDYKDELLDYYESRGMDKYAEKELNSHNQYLQTAASVGIITSVLLILTLGYYIWLGFKRRNFYLIALVTLFAVSCLFESMLERQWGILFFMFFLSIFLTNNPKQEEKAIALKSATAE